MTSPASSRLFVFESTQQQSQIDAVVKDIAEVKEQIAEVAKSIKLPQKRVVKVGKNIETTKLALKQANLLPDDKQILMMELQSLMDKEKGLMDKEKGLMDEKAKLMDEKAKLMDKEKGLSDRLNNAMNPHQPGPEFQWEAERVTLDHAVNWSSIELGDVVTVPLAHSGLKGGLSQQLYIRRACLDLFKFLSETPKNMLLVTGCPGVGKSIEVFSFALERAQLHRKRVLYIHGDVKSGLSVIFKDDPDTATARVGNQRFSEEPETLSLFIDSLLRQDLVDLIVLAGALSSLILNVFLKMDEYPSVKLVTCTSFQAPGKLSQEVSMKCAPRARFVMDSWQEDELYAALDAGALSLSPNTTSHQMFYYAGGSVRLFLARVEDVITEIESKIRQVPDMGMLVGAGGVGDSSASATNSLMAIYGGSSVVLSQFATRKLIDRVSDDFIRKARHFLPKNPSWQGWLFEAELMFMARNQQSMKFRNDSKLPSSVEIWEANFHVTSFKDTAELALAGPQLGWCQPTLWNQKGYDALFRVSSDKLRIIQISTSAKSRKFDLKDAIPLARATNAHEIEVVLICDQKNFAEVKISESAGIDSRRTLEAVLKEIADSKATPPTAQAITFRTVCYELD